MLVDVHGRPARRRAQRIETPPPGICPKAWAMHMGIDLSIVTDARASGGTVSSLGTGTATQWDGDTVDSVNGSGFTPASVVTIDGAAVSTTYVSPTQLQFTIPRADAASSPLRTSGVKVVQVVGASGNANLTVSAWTYSTATGHSLLLDAHGDNVSSTQWTETSGAGRHVTQAVAANNPTHTSSLAALGNMPALTFDGGNDFYAGTWTLDAIITTTAGTILTAFVATAVDTNDALIYENDSPWADNSGSHGLRLKSGGTMHANAFDSASRDASTPFVIGTACVGGWRHNGSNIFARKNIAAEVSAACTAGSSYNTKTLRIGRSYGSSSKWFAGSIGRIVAWNVSLSTANYERAIRKTMVEFSIS